MRKTLTIGLQISFMFLFIAMASSPFTTRLQAGQITITIKGSTTVLPIAQATAEVFMDRHPEVNISVQGGGSGFGIASLIDGSTDIADASRPMKEKEIIKARSKGVYPHEIIVAKDGIAIIVHPSNPVDNLTSDQILDIYSGKISDWSSLGGKNMKIVVVSRDTSSGTYEAFEELALKGERVRPDALTTASNQQVAMTVANTPGAIGYIGLGYLSSRLKAVKVNGIPCTADTVISGKYPLSRPLFMYTNGKPKGIIKDYIGFVLSEEGQRLVREQGYVGIR
ncbi:MAG: phosphate ABC transporter substrate-binding protein [Deltaproteobacteria bacterium]|nr:phosphate ABC transporter substrate-binding protein [Deltaproteobacteria bacterium]